jgi:hemin uptake protein HemP
MDESTSGHSAHDEPRSLAEEGTQKAPRWRSEDLLQGQREALIVHGSEVYRLRQTRNGKLILQK